MLLADREVVMHSNVRRSRFATISLGIAIVISLPTILLFSAVLGFAVFGAVGLISFVLVPGNRALQGWVPKAPIALGVISGLIIQVSGALPYMGAATVIFFAGGGAFFALAAWPEKRTRVKL
jgi:hypothetical protein